MNGWRGFAKLQRKQTLKAQQPAPNAQLRRLKTRWMTISTSLLRWDFCSNRFVKRIAQWIKIKWMRLRRVHGWTGGNGSTPFSILRPKLKSSFRPRSHSSHKNARTRGTKKIGNAATNCAIKFLRSAGKSATRRKDKNSRAALGPRKTV